MTTPRDTLQQMATGYVEAKILLSAAELRIFDLLAGEGARASAVARRIGGTQRGTEILLDALVAAEILDKQDGVYRNRPEYEEHLVSDTGDHFASMLRHRNRLFRRWAFLEEIIRGEEPQEGASHFSPGTDRTANTDFIQAMVSASGGRAPQIIAEIDLDGVKTLADLGGGPGHYLAEFLRQAPEIEAYLCDLPLTLEVARELHQDTALGARGHFVAWDLYQGQAPADLPPLDLAFISQVLHGESPEANQALLTRLFEKIAPGGRVVIHENVIDPSRISPRWAAIFAVNMLAMTRGGRTYTEAEYHAWGAAAGFVPRPGKRIDGRSFLVFLERPLR